MTTIAQQDLIRSIHDALQYISYYHAPDFVKIAEAYGAVGLRASKPAEVETVLSEGLSISRPVIMDFEVDREENVYPMVPAGAPITEMLLV